MVQVAPMPPGFDRAIVVDAATLPTTAPPVPTPAAPPAWGARAAEFDQGSSSSTPAAIAAWERQQATLAHWTANGTAIKHASQLVAEREERERQQEAERKARDPQKVLTAAHQMRAEAEAEVARLEPLARKASELVDDLVRRQREAGASITAGDQAATARLIEALAGGAGRGALPLNGRTDAARAAAATTAEKLQLATAAHDQLGMDLAAARDLLTRRGYAIARCAILVLVDEAADLADQILATDATTLQQRANLASLELLISAESRRLDGALPSLPAQVVRALTPVDQILHGRDWLPAAVAWRERFAELCAPPGEDARASRAR